jgi:hypothetical protein
MIYGEPVRFDDGQEHAVFNSRDRERITCLYRNHHRLFVLGQWGVTTRIRASLIIAHIGAGYPWSYAGACRRERMVQWFGLVATRLFPRYSLRWETFTGRVGWTPDPADDQQGAFCIMWIPARYIDRVANIPAADVPFCLVRDELVAPTRLLGA